MGERKLGFIGFGNMASAIASGVIQNELFAPADIFAFDPEEGKMNSCREQGMNPCSNSVSVLHNSDFVILAVKPQMMQAVLSSIAKNCGDKCLLSIAAGISTAYIKSFLPEDSFVIRVMPNTPLLVGCGATVIAENDNTPKRYFALAEKIFSGSGHVEYLPETQLDEIIGVNGSSPAFFFQMAQAMVQGAVKQGLPADKALLLAAKTMEGSARMLLESGNSPEELTKMVSSPGGTTIAALTAFEEMGYRDIIIEAMRRCTKRAKELGK